MNTRGARPTTTLDMTAAFQWTRSRSIIRPSRCYAGTVTPQPAALSHEFGDYSTATSCVVAETPEGHPSFTSSSLLNIFSFSFSLSQFSVFLLSFDNCFHQEFLHSCLAIPVWHDGCFIC